MFLPALRRRTAAERLINLRNDWHCCAASQSEEIIKPSYQPPPGSHNHCQCQASSSRAGTRAAAGFSLHPDLSSHSAQTETPRKTGSDWLKAVILVFTGCCDWSYCFVPDRLSRPGDSGALSGDPGRLGRMTEGQAAVVAGRLGTKHPFFTPVQSCAALAHQ